MWARGTYQTDGRRASWVKIKNPDYTQTRDRHELFETVSRVRGHGSRHSDRSLCCTDGADRRPTRMVGGGGVTPGLPPVRPPLREAASR